MMKVNVIVDENQRNDGPHFRKTSNFCDKVSQPFI